MRKLLLSVSIALLFAFVSAQDCQLVVPPRPLTAAGLSTPYLLQLNSTSTIGCTATNPMALGFVHGVILDLDTGAASVYNPLVITAGTAAAIQPTKPTLPANSVVALWFGYNGNTVTLVNTPGTNSTGDGACVNGLPTATGVDVFGQFAYCNAPAWFQAAQNLVNTGQMVVPPLGNGPDGQICPNVRAWDAIDQDQSDNVPSSYLIDGQTTLLAQNTAANKAALVNPTPQFNPSDNILITNFMMPAVNCGGSVWKVPDLADNGALTTALPLNEIQANMFALKPQALCPLSHAFTLLRSGANAGNTSPAKTNLYRVGVNQPKISETQTVITGQANPTDYCKKMNQIGGPRLASFKTFYSAAVSPTAGMNLYQFLTSRFTISNINLNCQNLIGAGNLFTNF